MYPIIVLEGIDASGKSAVGRRLAILQNGVYLKTPLPPFSDCRSIVDQSNDYAARFFFYLASVISASSLIANQSEKAPVIVDRWIWSTIANHRALGVDTSIVNPENLPLVRPQHAFLLTIDSEIQSKRLASRDPSMVSNLELNQELQMMVLAEFRRFRLNEIDTSCKTPDETAMIINGLIQHKGECSA